MAHSVPLFLAFCPALLALQPIAEIKGPRVTWALTITPDGKRLISGHYDTIRIRDLQNQNELGVLKGHSRGTVSLIVLPDQKTLISASSDHTIRIWDLSNKRQIGVLSGHQDGVTSLCLSPDGKTLASGSADSRVKLWDLEKKSELRTLEGRGHWVHSLLFAGDLLIVGAGGPRRDTVGELRFWDWKTGKVVAEFKFKDHKIFAMAVTKDLKTLVTAGDEGDIKFWDIKTKNHFQTIKAGFRVRKIALFEKERILLAAGGDATLQKGEIKTWEIPAGKEIGRITTDLMIFTLASSPNEETLATAGHGKRIDLWELKKVLRGKIPQIKNR